MVRTGQTTSLSSVNSMRARQNVEATNPYFACLKSQSAWRSLSTLWKAPKPVAQLTATVVVVSVESDCNWLS